MKQWKKYVGYDEWESGGMIGEETANPGPIDNSYLLEGAADVLTFLLFVLTTALAFLALTKWGTLWS